MVIPGLKRARMSFSGHERNHLFLNRKGVSFEDVSGLSGLNSDADGRSFAIVDLDRDGWRDIVLANVSSPVLNIYRNQMASLPTESDNKFLIVDCLGGNTTSQPSSEFTCADGIGAIVKVKIGDQVLFREKRCGEGLAAQNSGLLHFGLGRHASVDQIEVIWPSGKKMIRDNVPCNRLVKVFENTHQSPDDSGFLVESYALEQNAKTNDELKVTFTPPINSSAKIRMYVSMATWCPNCKKLIPQLRIIRNAFADSELLIVGVPIDPNDSDAKLSKYQVANNPPYNLGERWNPTDRDHFRKLAVDHLNLDVLPSTIFTDDRGNVLEILSGIASISQVAKLANKLNSNVD